MNPNSKSELRTVALKAVSQLRDKVRGLVREELLAAAEEVFSEMGLQSAKVEDIAARAGVSVGTVYNYFSDRWALVEAVMEARRQDLFRRLQQLDEQTQGQPFLQRLEAFLDRILEYFTTQRPYFLLALQAEGLPLKSSVLRQAPGCVGPFKEMFDHLKKIMAEGISAGVLRDEEPVALAAFFNGLTRGLGFNRLLDPSEPDLMTIKPLILRFFLHGAGKV